MGLGHSSRHQGNNYFNTNPSNVSTGKCAADCSGCLHRSAAWDLEFYVHGIDFLPEYEKRRRRLAKLVSGGQLWSWNASYMCFVSSATPYPKDSVTDISRHLSCNGKRCFLNIFIIHFSCFVKCTRQVA